MRKLVLVIFLVVLLLTTGCAKPETPQEQYQKKVAVQLEETQKKIEALKAGFQAQLAELQKKEEAVKQDLAELKAAGGEAWEKAKEKLDKAVAELEKSFEKMKAH